MPKRIIRVEVEADLHDAIQLEASKQGTTKAAIMRNCAQKFLSKVYDTSRPKSNSKASKGRRE